MSMEKYVVVKLNDKRNVFTTVPKSMRDEVVKKIGSYFKEGTRDVARGFSPDLERIIMPDIIGLQPNEMGYTSKVRDFWADFSLIPTVAGVRLNIATRKEKIKIGDNEEDIDMPVNPDDFMAYQICLNHPLIAKTKEERENLDNYDYYMIDEAEKEQQELDAYEIVEKADTLFARLVSKFTENSSKINWILELLKSKGEFFSSEMEDTKKKMMLRKKKEEDPTSFYKVANDPHLEQKAFLLQCLQYDVLTKEGNDYYNLDENIGSEKAVIAYLGKTEKSQAVAILKSKLEAKMITSKK